MERFVVVAKNLIDLSLCVV